MVWSMTRLEYAMPRKNKIINKSNKKKSDRKCKFCGETEYCVLDLHRIMPGKDGGKYENLNTVTCCSNCHRKIHEEKIKVDRMYFSTKGWVLHYFDEKGVEHWD